MGIRSRVMLLLVLISIFQINAFADSTCSASSTNGDQTCTVSCPSGQTAQCSNGSGSTPPDCHCSGTPGTSQLKTGRFQLDLTNAKKSAEAASTSTASLTTPAPVENTNLLDVINSRLATLPGHHLRDSCQQVLCGAFCINTAYQHINGKLTVQSPLIVSGGPTVKVSEPDGKSIPADFYLAHAKYKNCGTIQQSQTFQHSITLTEGTQITKTKALQTGSSVSLQMHADFKISDDFSLGGSTQYTLSAQSTITDANAESYTSQKQESVSNPILIPPMSEAGQC
jgi:hypothetical protein